MTDHQKQAGNPVVSFGEEDLEQAALLFGALKALRAPSSSNGVLSSSLSEGTSTSSSSSSSSSPDRLSALFDDHVRSVMTSLSNELSSSSSLGGGRGGVRSSPSLRSAAILQHKANLFDLCDSQLVELSAANAPPLGVVAQRLRDLKKGLLSSFAVLVSEQHATNESLLEKEKSMTLRAEAEVAELLQAAQLLERELVVSQNALKKAQLETADKEKERLRLEKELASMETRLRERERELGLSLNNTAAVTANAALSALYSSSSSSISSIDTDQLMMMKQSSLSEQQQSYAPSSSSSSSSSSSFSFNNLNQQSSSSTISSDVSFLRQRLGLSVTAPVGGGGPSNTQQQPLSSSTLSSVSSTSSPLPSLRQSPPMSSHQSYSSSSFRSSPQTYSPSATTTSSPPSSSSSFSPHSNIGGRILPLKVLLTEAEAIYASKSKSDAANPLLRETLEQHMYSFLKARHGAFASMIAANAATLIRSCNVYAPLDNDAAVFSKILRSEIDEDFRLVQKQVKETATELLRLQLKATFPLKLEPAINELFKERTNASSGVVDEDSWKAIVRYMYEAKDALVLEKRVVEHLIRAAVAHQLGYTESVEQMQRKALLSAKMVATGDGGGGDASNNVSSPTGDLETNHQQIQAAERSVERSLSSLSVEERNALLRRSNSKLKVLWSDFLRTLLDFQLEGHDAFLSKFRSLFRQYDPERRGVVSTSAFLQMAANVAIASSSSSSSSATTSGSTISREESGGATVGPEAAARLAVLADPGNVGQVTFSKAVAVLCKEAGVTNSSSNSSNTNAKQQQSAIVTAHVPTATGATVSLRSAQQQQQQQPSAATSQIRPSHLKTTDSAHRSARNMLFT
jgi:hypothetical protein